MCVCERRKCKINHKIHGDIRLPPITCAGGIIRGNSIGMNQQFKLSEMRTRCVLCTLCRGEGGPQKGKKLKR